MSFDIATLKQFPAFARLTSPAGLRLLHSIAQVCEPLNVTSGEVLFAEGSAGDALYLLLIGRLRASRVDGNVHKGLNEKILGEISRGETIGETGVLTGQVRSATVRALRDSQLLKIRKNDFDRLWELHPKAMMDWVRDMVLSMRQHWNIDHARHVLTSVRTIALVGCHAGVDLSRLSAQIENQAPQLGSLVVIDSAAVDAALGMGMAQMAVGDADYDVHNARILEWLQSLENTYRYVFYVADQPADNHVTGWTQRCLRQADRIVAITHIGEPKATPITEVLRDEQRLAPVELVLTHHQPHVVPHTTQWLQLLGATAHHHFRRAPADDLPRIVRLLTGQATGLVLSGGGARGFAHVGVLQALEELGIHIDILGGTSMGALIAAMHAYGYGLPELRSQLREMFVDTNYLHDYQIPRISLIKGHKFHARLQELFHGVQIENFALPYFCMTTNITKGTAAVHSQGDAAVWVGASMSVPGIAPAVVWQGELHVDGGVMDNLPVMPLHRQGRGRIIASDVASQAAFELNGVGQATPIQMSRELPHDLVKPEELPGIFPILFRAATLNSDLEQSNRNRYADVMLRLDIDNCGVFDWKQMNRLTEKGYRTAMNVIKQIKT